MIDYEVYLEKLAVFGGLLREQGLDVTPAETADAARVLIDIGAADRETVKIALRTVYAKNRDQQLRFDRAFDSFFLTEEMIRALDEKHRQQELEQARAQAQAQEQLGDAGEEFSQEQIEAYSRLSREQQEHLQQLKERFTGEDSRNRELYGNFIHSIFARSIMEQQLLMEDAALGSAPIDPDAGMLFKDISQFEDHEIPKAVYYIQGLSKQITGELTQKRKRAVSSHILDFRRTIRKGLETGGAMVRLKHKRKRSSRKQLVILCDVSGSMIRFSEFALRFIQSLNQASESSRVFLFSEEMVEADIYALHDMDRFRDYVRQSGMFGRGTNLGAALMELNEKKPPVLSPSSTLLVLSDGKTVDTGQALEQLAKARARAGRVIFLNPIPQSKWKYSGNIQSLSKLCTMISCSTLQELAGACRKLANI